MGYQTESLAVTTTTSDNPLRVHSHKKDSLFLAILKSLQAPSYRAFASIISSVTQSARNLCCFINLPALQTIGTKLEFIFPSCFQPCGGVLLLNQEVALYPRASS